MRMMRPPHHHSCELINNSKCRTAIPVRTALHRDLVVQSVLDGTVRSIEFMNEVRFRNRSIPVASIVVRRDDGHFMFDVVGFRPDRNPDEEEILRFGLQEQGVQVLEVSPEDVRCEPRHSNARQVWRHRHARPTSRERERVLDALAEDGPRSLRELERTCHLNSYVREIVSALACNDALEIDINSRPLGPDTIVRPRR